MKPDSPSPPGKPAQPADADAMRIKTDSYLSPNATAAMLTRLELAIMRSSAAFSRWAPELHKLATDQQLTYQEACVLHCLRLRGGSSTLAELLIFLHRHDLAALQYSLRKLEKAGLVRRAKGSQRREIYYYITEKGQSQTDAYAEQRKQLLVSLCDDVVGLQANMGTAAKVLERLTSLYDQATQDALNQHLLSSAPRAWTTLPKRRKAKRGERS
jgi:predicted MarR family transcription regulator